MNLLEDTLTEPAARSAFEMPRAPHTLEQTGVGFDVIQQLVVKTLNFAGELPGVDIAARLGVLFAVIEPVLEFLKRERHCEISSGGVVGPSAYRYRLTDSGRARAAVFLEHNQYVDQVPVPLDQYVSYMRRFGSMQLTGITRDSIRAAYSHLVLSDHVLDQLGPALTAQHSLFIYGPPGNGKTVISQAIRQLLVGDIAVPHALCVDGHIVRLFDPVIHQPRPAEKTVMTLEREDVADDRWVRCRRPLVLVGGELRLAALELGYNEASGVYTSPVQTLANGGVLVIDDFGRQHASPRDLLNRWIVPLESRVDYMTLQTGQKFELPFEALVVFATNIKPTELVDEAFLRRIQYKVHAQSPTREQFIRIFENYCRDNQVAFDRAMVETLLDVEIRPRNVPLRGCQPRDLIEQALAFAAYMGQPRRLTLELLKEACSSYFVDDKDFAAE